jgi:hypothetical protein
MAKLQRRRLRRPRYRGEHGPLLGIGEARGAGDAFPWSLANFQTVFGNLTGVLAVKLPKTAPRAAIANPVNAAVSRYLDKHRSGVRAPGWSI